MREYCRKVWLGFYTALLGMKVTLKYMFSPAITLQYPDEKWEIPDGNRGKLDVNLADCIGCLQCARACPPECITIQTKKAPPGVDMGKTSDGTKKKLVVPVFDIDLTKCLYCGLCVEACPTGCIRMTKDYEYSVYDRHELLLSFGKDLDPAIVAAAAEKVAAEKAAAEKAEAAAGASEKAGAKAEADGSKGAAERKPGGAEAAGGSSSKAKGPETAAKPKPEEPGGAGTAGGPKPQAKAPETSGKPHAKPGGTAPTGEKKAPSSGDKTPPPSGDTETPSE